MAKKTTGKKKLSPKKELHEKVLGQIRESLDSTLKELLGEKKFDRRTMRASKLLLEGVKLKTPAKAKPRVKKVADEVDQPANVSHT